MKISILDPGLKTLSGHHFDLDLRLFGAFSRRGHQVAVHGHVEAHPVLLAKAQQVGMRFHSTFTADVRASAPGTHLNFEAYSALEQATTRDLATLDRSDLWLWPTMPPYQLAAAASQRDAVRQIGGAWGLPGRMHPAGARSWAATARELGRAPHRIVVGAYDELLCRGCQDFAPELEVELLPCPHDGAANESGPTRLRRIGFFGHQRTARGIDLIPELASSLQAKGYEVVVQDSSGRLRRKRDSERITLLERVDDFAAELARCDAVIWPSRWEFYTQALSGVVCESIASGVPVIAPSGCIPAQVVDRYRSGLLFHDHSVSAILDAVERAAHDFPGLSARAREGSAAWHARNGTDRLVQWIEQRVGAMN